VLIILDVISIVIIEENVLILKRGMLKYLGEISWYLQRLNSLGKSMYACMYACRQKKIKQMSLNNTKLLHS